LGLGLFSKESAVWGKGDPEKNKVPKNKIVFSEKKADCGGKQKVTRPAPKVNKKEVAERHWFQKNGKKGGMGKGGNEKPERKRGVFSFAYIGDKGGKVSLIVPAKNKEICPTPIKNGRGQGTVKRGPKQYQRTSVFPGKIWKSLRDVGKEAKQNAATPFLLLQKRKNQGTRKGREGGLAQIPLAQGRQHKGGKKPFLLGAEKRSRRGPNFHPATRPPGKLDERRKCVTKRWTKKGEGNCKRGNRVKGKTKTRPPKPEHRVHFVGGGKAPPRGGKQYLVGFGRKTLLSLLSKNQSSGLNCPRRGEGENKKRPV